MENGRERSTGGLVDRGRGRKAFEEGLPMIFRPAGRMMEVHRRDSVEVKPFDPDTLILVDQPGGRVAPPGSGFEMETEPLRGLIKRELPSRLERKERVSKPVLQAPALRHGKGVPRALTVAP